MPLSTLFPCWKWSYRLTLQVREIVAKVLITYAAILILILTLQKNIAFCRSTYTEWISVSLISEICILTSITSYFLATPENRIFYILRVLHLDLRRLHKKLHKRRTVINQNNMRTPAWSEWIGQSLPSRNDKHFRQQLQHLKQHFPPLKLKSFKNSRRNRVWGGNQWASCINHWLHLSIKKMEICSKFESSSNKRTGYIFPERLKQKPAIILQNPRTQSFQSSPSSYWKKDHFSVMTPFIFKIATVYTYLYIIYIK